MAKVISATLPDYESDTNSMINGYPRFTILEYRESSDLALKIFAAWMVLIPCLFGVPANSVSTYVEIQTDWMDGAGNIISSQVSQGYNKTFVAMYWGYGADARKRSNMLAMQEALRNSQH